MSEFLTSNLVAIDTNVFQHLLNPQNNPDSHINRLLEHLTILGTSLLVDTQGVIASEYNQQLTRRIRNADDLRNEIQLLRYWVLEAPRLKVSVTEFDQLMRVIRSVIVEDDEDTDRTFVYVAFRQGTVLVTNDRRHIVRRPGGGSTFRRDILLEQTVGLRPETARIMTSEEACAALATL